MTEFIQFVTEHGPEIITALLGTKVLANLIVNFTETPADRRLPTHPVGAEEAPRRDLAVASVAPSGVNPPQRAPVRFIPEAVPWWGGFWQ